MIFCDFSEDAGHDTSVHTNPNSDSEDNLDHEEDELQKLADLVGVVNLKDAAVETKGTTTSSEALDLRQLQSTPSRKRTPSEMSNSSLVSHGSTSQHQVDHSVELSKR